MFGFKNQTPKYKLPANAQPRWAATIRSKWAGSAAGDEQLEESAEADDARSSPYGKGHSKGKGKWGKGKDEGSCYTYLPTSGPFSVD